MIKCNKGEVQRLKKGAALEEHPGKAAPTRPDGVAAGGGLGAAGNCFGDGGFAEHGQSRAHGL